MTTAILIENSTRRDRRRQRRDDDARRRRRDDIERTQGDPKPDGDDLHAAPWPEGWRGIPKSGDSGDADGRD